MGIFSFALSVVAWISCFPLSKVPSVRATLWPVRMMFYAALIMGFIAWPGKDSTERNWIIATFISFALFTAYNYVVLRMPRVSQLRAGAEFPDVVPLVAADGSPLPIKSFRGKGPVLLIFFRGFW